MAQKRRTAAFVVVVIVLAVLLVFCLAGLAIGVGVAVTGSDSYNNCKGSTSFCEQMQEQTKHASYGLMTAASVVTVLFFPAIATVLAYFLLELVSGRAGRAKAPTNSLEPQPRKAEEANQNELEATERADQDEATEGKELEFHDYTAIKLDRRKLKELTLGAGVILFFAMVCFTLALVGALWMLVVAYDNPAQTTTQLWPFIVPELILGLICPLLACVGCALLAIVGKYITAEQIDLRIIIPQMLPSVVLKPEKSSMYWVIIEHFHIELRKPWGQAGELKHAISRNLSTWLLAVIVGLAVTLSASSFINRSVVQTLTVPTAEFLEESDICLTYSCFTAVTFNHLNVTCSDVNSMDWTNINIVHCFKFIPLSSETIANLAIAVSFYLATVYFIQVIFVVATVLHVEKSHIVWGIFFVIAGVVTFGGALFYIFLPHFAKIRLDVILAGQIILVAVYLVIIGVLLCTGDVYAVKKKPGPAALQTGGEGEGDLACNT